MQTVSSFGLSRIFYEKKKNPEDMRVSHDLETEDLAEGFADQDRRLRHTFNVLRHETVFELHLDDVEPAEIVKDSPESIVNKSESITVNAE